MQLIYYMHIHFDSCHLLHYYQSFTIPMKTPCWFSPSPQYYHNFRLYYHKFTMVTMVLPQSHPHSALYLKIIWSKQTKTWQVVIKHCQLLLCRRPSIRIHTRQSVCSSSHWRRCAHHHAILLSLAGTGHVFRLDARLPSSLQQRTLRKTPVIMHRKLHQHSHNAMYHLSPQHRCTVEWYWHSVQEQTMEEKLVCNCPKIAIIITYTTICSDNSKGSPLCKTDHISMPRSLALYHSNAYCQLLCTALPRVAGSCASHSIYLCITHIKLWPWPMIWNLNTMHLWSIIKHTRQGMKGQLVQSIPRKQQTRK